MNNKPKVLLSAVARTRFALLSGVMLVGCSSRSAPEQLGQGAQSLSLPGVSLQTLLVPRYLGAQNNGGGVVNATASMAQAWETFTLEDQNGGALVSGDSVALRSGAGRYLQALNGGGSSVNAAGAAPGAWETFKIVRKAGGGTLTNGDIVGLQASSGAWVSAELGGGGSVFAYGGALGSWEQFKIAGLPVTVPPTTPSLPSSVSLRNVSLKTALQGRFVGAVNNGGAGIVATATSAQAWESFTFEDVNGGSLESGDAVFVRAGSGQYVQAQNGGGSSVDATANAQPAFGSFKLIKKTGSGSIKTGDTVGLQAPSGAWLSAENGGGGSVFAYGGALGSWEAFVIGIGAPPATPTPSGWRLVWSDEFDGNNVDGSKWRFDVQGPGWSNNELQSYTARAENARVESGHLVIEARRDFFGGEYSSARMNTYGKASFTYGRFEVRAQLPGGRGTWPAFWLMPDDFSRGWPACGEVDILEEVGYDPDNIHATTHSLTYNWKGVQQRTAIVNVPGVTSGYHVYAAEWYPDRVDFFVDDKKYFSSPNDNTGDDAWPFHKNFYMILNLAVGGDWGGYQGVDANIWPRQMLVDYVRVYQR